MVPLPVPYFSGFCCLRYSLNAWSVVASSCNTHRSLLFHPGLWFWHSLVLGDLTSALHAVSEKELPCLEVSGDRVLVNLALDGNLCCGLKLAYSLVRSVKVDDRSIRTSFFYTKRSRRFFEGTCLIYKKPRLAFIHFCVYFKAPPAINSKNSCPWLNFRFWAFKFPCTNFLL